VLGFNEQLEHIAEVAMVVLLGSLLLPLLPSVPGAALWFIPLLLLLIRPPANAPYPCNRSKTHQRNAELLRDRYCRQHCQTKMNMSWKIQAFLLTL